MSTFSDIIEGEKLTLIDFSAEWCNPCKMLAPILKEVKDKVKDKVVILKIDIDKNKELAAIYKVQSIPTLIIFKKGEIKWRESGIRPAHELVELINKYG